MRIGSAFPSDYLKAADLQGRPFRLTIKSIIIDKIGDDQKPVVYFNETEKGLVLNKTNANNISIIYSDETDMWIGKQIELYPATTDFQGRTVDCVRVRAPQVQQTSAPTPTQQHLGGGGEAYPGPGPDDLDDSIPFISPWGVR